MDKKKFSKPAEPPERRQRVNDRNKQLLMAIMLRNPDVFTALRSELVPAHFGGFDTYYAVALTCVTKHFDEYGALPDFELLSGMIEEACENNPDTLNSAEQQRLSEFLELAYDPKTFSQPVTSQEYADWATKIGIKLAEERIAAAIKEVTLTRDTVPVNMPAILAQLHADSERVASLSADEITLAWDDKWDKEANIQVFPTGLEFIDDYLGGGHAPGEVYGLMGPYGSCKSTMAYMLAVLAAEQFAALAQRPDYDGRPRVAFIVSYEDRFKMMRLRSLGYAARIARRTLETMDPDHGMLSSLSRSADLKPYEREMFRTKLTQGAPVDGELERAQAAIARLNPHLVLLDMTGHRKKGDGTGGLQEVARRVTHELRLRGNARCGFLEVDYAGAAVKRYMQANDISNDQLRHEIGGLPLKAKSMLADVFDCPTWLLHQLSGEANNRSPGVLMNHTDAAEAKNWGENLDFNFVIGVPDKIDRVALFGCTKSRRQEPKKDTIIRIDGAMNRVQCVSDKYVLDTTQKKIMRIEDYNRFAGSETHAAQEPAHNSSELN